MSWTGQEQRRKKVMHMLAKRDKLDMIETLIGLYEGVDPEYVKDLKRRANDIRTQLKVASTLT